MHTPKSELLQLIETLGAPSEFRSMKPGLERISALCAQLGHPENNFPVVQIVGTNGKGSTTYYLTQILLQSGYKKVGSFFSPHLLDFNERININGQPVDDETLLSALKRVQKAAQALDEPVSFFETVTAAALLIFSEAGIEIAAMEAGLGGRLDATSVTKARWGVITEVALDHCHILGSTIPLIMAEKLAAFKNCQTIICGPQTEEGQKFLADFSSSAAIIEADTDFFIHDQQPDFISIQSGSEKITFNRKIIGQYRRRAMALAWKAAQVITHDTGYVLPFEAFDKIEVNFPGRLHFLSENPPIIADISHNPAGIEALLEALSELHTQKPWLIIFGAMADKDYPSILQYLSNYSTYLLLPVIPGPRAAKPTDIAGHLPKSIAYKITQTIDEACLSAQTMLTSGNYCGILACGSNYLAGPVIKYFASK